MSGPQQIPLQNPTLCCNYYKDVTMVFNRIKLQALYLIMFVLLMIGLSYASVPLYKIFCQVTGYGGTPQVSEENNTKVISEIVSDK